MARPDYARFADLTYEDFRRLAVDDSLTPYERIGFPDEYRAGLEEAIFEDIASKLPALSLPRQVVLDIGPGCSDLPAMIRRRCEDNDDVLLLVDSAEMLAHHADGAAIRKYPAQFPDCPSLFEEWTGRIDAIVAYSVLHYVPLEEVHRFVDRAIELLAAGGRMLIGDVPNVSKRQRFFSSAAGRAFHQRFTGSDASPQTPPVSGAGAIDDDVVLGIVERARKAGFDAFVVPQAERLPMANRREDLLVCRP